jgi:hypothetical protein
VTSRTLRRAAVAVAEGPLRCLIGCRLLAGRQLLVQLAQQLLLDVGQPVG